MSNMLSITVDLSSIIGAQGVITREIFPRLREAVGAVAQEAQNRWADSIMKAPGVWYVEKQEYVGSLRWEYTGEFEARVFSDYKKADWIENGRPSIDLKYMLNTSMKVRMSKKGKRYLIIPFRHNTTGNGAHARAMPANIYAQAKELPASRITGHGQRVSGTGAWDIKTKQPYMVRQRQYDWGGRLPRQQPKGQRDIHEGMVRFNTSAGKGKSSAYLTFRVMSEGSSGWVTKAKPGLMLAQGVTNALSPLAEQVFQKAVQLDISGR